MRMRTSRIGGLLATASLATVALALPASAIAAPGGHAAPGKHHPRHRIGPCRASSTTIWLGLGAGGGTAGTIFYPLEFSNTGRRTCALFGFPGVAAVKNGHQVGGAAIRAGSKHLAVLRPGQTAHAVLGIVEAGNIPSCNMVQGANLKVFAPNQQASTIIPSFTFTACANRTVLRIRSVRFGVGIPGFNTP
ncbi:MAG TPA: DUF4232 domain-containing protein [Streptosporangiaceae bacterium]|jgi:hypothetical protein|nr:DUF4232 domain-containing protein [Streptosporangiaceae bacterium]